MSLRLTVAARSLLSVGDGRKLAQRILKLRAKCDNVWAVVTLNGGYVEQVRCDPTLPWRVWVATLTNQMSGRSSRSLGDHQ